jgi:hypothetical protein
MKDLFSCETIKIQLVKQLYCVLNSINIRSFVEIWDVFFSLRSSRFCCYFLILFQLIFKLIKMNSFLKLPFNWFSMWFRSSRNINDKEFMLEGILKYWKIVDNNTTSTIWVQNEWEVTNQATTNLWWRRIKQWE